MIEVDESVTEEDHCDFRPENEEDLLYKQEEGQTDVRKRFSQQFPADSFLLLSSWTCGTSF